MSDAPPFAERQEQRPVKSEAAFRTISEVVEELDVPQHVLRFWETRFSQVRPLKRAGGRRYYRPEDVALLKRIRDLLYRDGFTIKGVQKLLHEHGARAVMAGEAGAQALVHEPDGANRGNGDSREPNETSGNEAVPLETLEMMATSGAAQTPENALPFATGHPETGQPMAPAGAPVLRAVIADLETLRRELMTALGQGGRPPEGPPSIRTLP